MNQLTTCVGPAALTNKNPDEGHEIETVQTQSLGYLSTITLLPFIFVERYLATTARARQGQ